MSNTQQIRQMMKDYDADTTDNQEAFYKYNAASLKITFHGADIIRHLIADNSRIHKALHKLRGEQFTHALKSKGEE